MDEGDSSENEIITNDYYTTEEGRETQAVRINHELTYFDEEGIEYWQTEQEISQKLWHLTKVVNLTRSEK